MGSGGYRGGSEIRELMNGAWEALYRKGSKKPLSFDH